MQRLTRGMKLVVASHNKGKVWEINQLLARYGLDAVCAGDLGLPEPEETETTFEGNARLKAVAAARGSRMPALADDSGLEVDCLGGAPGIYSARWAGAGKDFGLAMRKLNDEISARNGWPVAKFAGSGPRANFISVLCLVWPDGAARVFEGKVHGHLVWPPRGGNGFGYDPMFVADGETQTFGEMEPAGKYAISHRTRAFAKFKAECLDQIDAGPVSDHTTGTIGGRDLAALTAAAANLSTREELVQFISNLRADLDRNKADWKNGNLEGYLGAMRGNLARARAPSEPEWRTIAKALLAASLDE